MPLPVAIVPHTHWDREWYSPFQTYRLRLVKLLDDFLPLLERDPGYRHFLLDGQTAVIDDYVEIRPEAEDRIRRLVTSGRLSVGPWMILMDEFMVSGETMIRNLQMGLRRGAELGGTMEVGYLPDMFGHVAQMPQILRLAGLEHAVVWRGVPAAIRSTGFWWEAPDGSRVRAEYLYGSYSNGRDIPRDPELLIERARNYRHELGTARLDGMLLMNGTDHQVPQSWLGEVVAGANAVQEDFDFRVVSLADHVQAQPVDGLPTWQGELRSGARANLLMGVASNRVDVHQACARAERALERRAEPLAALVYDADDYPSRLLDVAWHHLVVNSAHDSSCACSHDEVVDQVLVRYREARQIGEGIASDAVKLLAAFVGAPAGATVVVNPTARTRNGLVEVPVPGEGPLHFDGPHGPVPAQLVRSEAGERFATQVVGSKLAWVLDMLRGEEFAGGPVHDWSIHEREEGVWDVTIRHAGPQDPRADVSPLREALETIVEGSTDGDEPVLHIRAVRSPVRRVLLAADDVAGFGWSTFVPVEGDLPTSSVRCGPLTLGNEYVEVEVDPATGTFTIADRASGHQASGLNRYVNGGDGGDTYNWSPPARDLVVDGAESVAVSVVESGPLRARLLVTTTHRWPTHAEGDERSCSRRSDETADVTIATTLELRTGEPMVRIHTEIDNRCRDQRLRVHFPLPASVDGSDAECAFAVVRRGLDAEGGPSEVGLPTYPSRRFVDASDGEVGLAVIHDGLLEHEVVEGRELAITLLRSVGYLSRVEPSLRPNPAGPPVPVEGAQMLGRQAFDYAVALHTGDWQSADLYGLADHFLVPLERAPAGGPSGPRAATGRLLEVEGAEVSACCRVEGGLLVRLFNPGPAPATVTVRFPDLAAGWTIDLRGHPVAPFESPTELRPFEIRTVLFGDT